MMKNFVRGMMIAPATLLLLGLAGTVAAQDVNVNASAEARAKVRMDKPMIKPMEVKIENNGQVKLAGTIASISGNTVVVTSWGGSWTVDATNAKFTRKAGGTSSLAEMKAGDRIMVTGKMQESGLAITAKVIHNESIHAIASNKVGTVSNVNSGAGTFTLTTREGALLQVTTNADTKFWLGKATSTFSALIGLSATTTVRVDGVINKDAGTVIASKVQVGLPLTVKPLKSEVKAGLKHRLDLRLDR